MKGTKDSRGNSDRDDISLSRRRFLRTGLLTTAAIAIPGAALAGLRVPAPERSLSFYNLHTGESAKATYWSRGRYLEDGLAEINHIMRDFRQNEIKPIDVNLLNLLHR